MDSTFTGTAAAQMIGGTKVYGDGDTEVRALDGVDVEFEKGRFTAIMGPSGSGKSTLMHCSAGLDDLTSGTVNIGDEELGRLSERDLTLLRRDKVGFVFQSYNLIPTLTAEENLTLPLDLAGRKPDTSWMVEIVETVGLQDRLHHRPDELSGGQQQRVAVARALANRPKLVLADEPTGNLDPASAAESLGLIRETCRENGAALLLVSHDREVLGQFDNVRDLADINLAAGSPSAGEGQS